jgi:hypothetical protein
MTVFGHGQHGQALRPHELGWLQRAPQYRPSLAGPYRDHLRKRRAKQPAVPVPVRELLREIPELGYQGSSNLLVRYLNQDRAEGNRPHLSAAGLAAASTGGRPEEVNTMTWMIERQMHGRVGFAFLGHRILLV